MTPANDIMFINDGCANALLSPKKFQESELFFFDNIVPTIHKKLKILLYHIRSNSVCYYNNIVIAKT